MHCSVAGPPARRRDVPLAQQVVELSASLAACTGPASVGTIAPTLSASMSACSCALRVEHVDDDQGSARAIGHGYPRSGFPAPGEGGLHRRLVQQLPPPAP
jgi:hypothetical protein